MIEKAVLSYFNSDESFGNKGGYARFSDFLFTTALSITCASRHFKEVQFISSDWGVDLMKQFNMPITSYSNRLNELKTISPFFWAYGKILTYCEQDVPFVHIDNDVFLWDPLPPKILKAKLCFQTQEPFALPGYEYYNMLRRCWDKAPSRPQEIVDNPVYDFAYNCGICGGHYLDFFKEWEKCSSEYIFAPENQKLFFKNYRRMLIHQNLWHEQYFASCLIKKHDLRKQVRFLAKDAMDIESQYRYTHLWGTVKLEVGAMAMVRLRLLERNPELFNQLNKFCRTNKI
jgi:hypothetical protein